MTYSGTNALPDNSLTSFALHAADGTVLHVRAWQPEIPPKAVVQIAHGLAEHSGRYTGLADELSRAGFAVYANDHRGHGLTAAGNLGFFAEEKGWDKCLDDLWLLNRRIADDHAELPIVLLGHSMGAFMAQQFAIKHGDVLSGMVLSGSDGRPSLLAQAGRLAARLERMRLGPRGRSDLLRSLSFGAFNRPFAPARTAYDWLSRDEAEVDSYLADPLCGFAPSVQLWIDLLDALPQIARPERQALIPKQLPIYVVSGARDSVSAKAKGVDRLVAAYRNAGLRQVTQRIYPEARHELFHEINRAEVMRDLLAWLNQNIS